MSSYLSLLGVSTIDNVIGNNVNVQNVTTNSVTVSPPFSLPAIPVFPKNSRLRRGIPEISGTLPGNTSQNEVLLSSNASDIDNFYQGSLFVL